jgi:hypothetical protein
MPALDPVDAQNDTTTGIRGPDLTATCKHCTQQYSMSATTANGLLPALDGEVFLAVCSAIQHIGNLAIWHAAAGAPCLGHSMHGDPVHGSAVLPPPPVARVMPGHRRAGLPCCALAAAAASCILSSSSNPASAASFSSCHERASSGAGSMP